MKNWHTHVFTSTYTADVSGVCSMLYELGGMTVLHDPSGCNSTYTTHDEPRWYDSDSLMFISGLDEMTAVLGDDNVLIQDVVKAAADLKPRFITLCGASIPHIIAFDYRGAAKLIEKETGIPVLPVPTDGLRSYVSGCSLAMKAWIRRFGDRKAEKIKGRINLLGVTPIDFSNDENVNAMRRAMEDAGFSVRVFAMGESFEALTEVYAAECNVVVSSAGRGPAQYLWKTAGIPYVEGLPSGEIMVKRIADAIRKGGCTSVCQDYESDGKILVIGEEIFACTMASLVHGTPLWPDVDEGLDEDTLMEKMEQADIVIGDPLFQYGRKGNAKFIPFPHEGYSGRIFRDDIPVFTGIDFDIERFIRGKL